MIQILLYTRENNKSLQLLSDNLSSMGYQVEQTHFLNIPRIVLNPNQVVHFLIEQLPLNANEIFYLSLAKTLGKVTVLSIFDCNQKQFKSPFLKWFAPDALTVSQTNYLKSFRNWNCSKSIFPYLPDIKSAPARVEKKPLREFFLIPLQNVLEDVFLYKTEHMVYFDGTTLLKDQPASNLRKKWSQFLQTKKVPQNYHLILSDKKINELLNAGSIELILANPNLPHTVFTKWLELAFNKNNSIILNDFQATSFSQAWTSGRNCLVLPTSHWLKELNNYFSAADAQLGAISNFRSNQLYEPLVNDLSRLYTKILHQKTSLLSSDSVNINT